MPESMGGKTLEAGLCWGAALDEDGELSSFLVLDDSDFPRDACAGPRGSIEPDGIYVDVEVSGLGSPKLTADFDLAVTSRDFAVTRFRATVRLCGANGERLDDVAVDVDLLDNPLVEGMPQSVSVEIEAGEDVASVQILDLAERHVQPIWAGCDVRVFLLGERRDGCSNGLSLLLEGVGALESLVLEARVCDASGAEVDAPEVVVVDPEGEPLALDGSAVVPADLPWGAGAAGWSVVSGDVRRKRGENPALESLDTVEFGSYPTAFSGGRAPIEWLVLASMGDHRLLLAKDVLDSMPYNDTSEPVGWEGCALRSWLNGAFLQAAFSEEEKARIVPVAVKGDGGFDGDGMEDCVFCLSPKEACGYFGAEPWAQLYEAYGHGLGVEEICGLMPGNEALVAYPTDYAVERGEELWCPGGDVLENGGSSWWLRPDGGQAGWGAFVAEDGAVVGAGGRFEPKRGIRPALVLMG